MDLYALPPEEFTAARDALAKQDKAVKGLRRPTVAAWVVNTLVRRDAPLLEQLLALGAELAQAQSGQDAGALRTLGDQRRQLVAAVTTRAVEVTERDVTPAVRAEVAATLEAALSDPASAAAVRSGNLVRSLSFAGFGGVDLAGAVAEVRSARPAATTGTDPAGRPTSPRASGSIGAVQSGPAGARSAGKAVRTSAGKAAKEAPAKVRKLEAAALEAHGALDDAVRRTERIDRDRRAADREAASAVERLDAAAARVADLRAALTLAEKDLEVARAERKDRDKVVADLTRKGERAQAVVATSQELADRARAALDAVRRA